MADPGRSAEDARGVRIGRILCDLRNRRVRGEAVSEADVLAAYPDLADDLREHFETLGDLLPSDDRIEGLIAQDVLAKSTETRYPAELGAYKIIGFIGRGGMGIVLKAYEESLNRTVALKILRPELADDANALKRFHREAKAVAALHHPNIVTVYAVGEERSVQFLAMQYIEGPTLSRVIRESGPLPAGTVRRLFGQLLAGLEAAHGTGLIHRDIKPSNLLLDCEPAIGDCSPAADGRGSSGTESNNGVSSALPAGPSPSTQSSIVNHRSSILMLADFGLARMLIAQTRLTLSDSILGTAEYMSPEQARGDEHLDHHTDLYSAGVVLYEMLTGRTPFQADTPSAVIHRILHEDPTDPRTIAKAADPHLASLALRLMAKRPEDRFASAAEVIKALEAGERVRSLAARRIRRRWMIASLIFLGLALGAGTLGSLYATRGNQVSNVRIDPDIPLALQVRRGNKTEWEPFYAFPVEARTVNDVTLVDTDGNGHMVVVAGVNNPVDGYCVFSFNTEGESVWRLDLSSDRQWPDCGRPTQWFCKCLAAGDLDGEPGEEIVAIGSDLYEYATRVSIINPRTEEIKATFWHMGRIDKIRILPAFFGPGRPAIIAHGLNNKLDVFEDGARDDPLQLAHWDIVQVVMILDPSDMDGLGPPRTARGDIPPARVYAYAYLDLRHESNVSYVPTTEEEAKRVIGDEEDIGRITLVSDASYEDNDGTGPWFMVGISAPGEGDELVGIAGLIVDRNLGFCEAKPSWVKEIAVPEGYWRQHWRPIIQNGKYVDE